jgi:hypothetical protein
VLRDALADCFAISDLVSIPIHHGDAFANAFVDGESNVYSFLLWYIVWYIVSNHDSDPVGNGESDTECKPDSDEFSVVHAHPEPVLKPDAVVHSVVNAFSDADELRHCDPECVWDSESVSVADRDPHS